MLSEKLISPGSNVMLDSLKRFADEYVETHKKFVVWGCGNTGKIAINFLKEYTHDAISPEYIIDNNKSSWDGQYVYGPDYFANDMKHIDVVLVCVYVADQIMTQLDEMGYSGDRMVVSSSVFTVDQQFIEFYDSNMEKIEEIYEMLADDRSRSTVETYLNVIRSGDISLWESVNGDSRYKLVDPEILKCGSCENYVDIGAFIGDTLKRFLELTNGKYESVVCIEPDFNNYNVLTEYIDKEQLSNVSALNVAAGDKCEELNFVANCSESCGVSENGDTTVKVITLDSLKAVQKVSVLKISANGYDLNVLKGAERLIKENTPTIACYASMDQLWTVPKFLKTLIPEYNIYYRHYGVGRQAMICYATIQ